MKPELSICIPHYPYSEGIDDIMRENINLILKHTKTPFEIILIWVGCVGQTVIWCDKRVKSTIIRERIGNPKGWNEGLKRATGDYICFMDNDVKVYDGWDIPCIENLKEPDIGLVTPDVWLRENNTDKWFSPRDNQQGSCMFLTRSFLEQLENPYREDPGCFGFDERFEPGYAEDTDLFMRVWIRGKKRVMAMDSRVDHLGGSTFTKVYKDVEKVAGPSREKFEEKWACFENKKMWGVWNQPIRTD